MHDDLMVYLKGLKKGNPGVFQGRILEYGSYDINGSCRHLFDTDEYIGVDHRPGPGVDVVTFMHSFNDEKGFDTIVTTSTLEHDPWWKFSLERCVKLLKPGGNLIITTVGPGWPIHELEVAPIKNYYSGLDTFELSKTVLLASRFRSSVIFDKDETNELYAHFLGKIQEAHP